MLLEICVHLNLLRQVRGRSATQGWQVKATAEGPLCPSCCVCGAAQRGLPSTNCPLCNQGHSLPVVQGNRHYEFVLWSTKGYLSYNLISQKLYNPPPPQNAHPFGKETPKGQSLHSLPCSHDPPPKPLTASPLDSRLTRGHPGPSRSTWGGPAPGQHACKARDTVNLSREHLREREIKCKSSQMNVKL